MVRVERQVVHGQTYWYLAHTVRSNGKVVQKRRYLGRMVPKDVEQAKRELLDAIRQERWRPVLERIGAAHRAERKRMPSVVREKEDGGFAVRFTYDTQRIEGSKLTLRETADLLERGVVPLRKPLADVNEAEAHRRVFEAALADRREVTLARVLEWHRLLFGETKPGIAGKVREHRVMIARSDFEPPTPVELGPLLRDFFRWWARSAKMHPVERAALAHLKLVTIHPFADGNGRISRLLMNVVLERGGYPLLNIRYENRASYYTALERAQVKGEERIFIDWFIKRYVKEHRWYLR